jgi:hypothetical protein
MEEAFFFLIPQQGVQHAPRHALRKPPDTFIPAPRANYATRLFPCGVKIHLFLHLRSCSISALRIRLVGLIRDDLRLEDH